MFEIVSEKSGLEMIIMEKKKQELEPVPGKEDFFLQRFLQFYFQGFGFYHNSVWSIFSPFRKVEGGNHSDEEVCNMLGLYWEMEKQEVEQLECPPQWVSD